MLKLSQHFTHPNAPQTHSWTSLSPTCTWRVHTELAAWYRIRARWTTWKNIENANAAAVLAGGLTVGASGKTSTNKNKNLPKSGGHRHSKPAEVPLIGEQSPWFLQGIAWHTFVGVPQLGPNQSVNNRDKVSTRNVAANYQFLENILTSMIYRLRKQRQYFTCASGVVVTSHRQWSHRSDAGFLLLATEHRDLWKANLSKDELKIFEDNIEQKFSKESNTGRSSHVNSLKKPRKFTQKMPSFDSTRRCARLSGKL